MSFAAVLAIVALGLFGLLFLTKRRFGVLGLAMAAGATLSSLWVADLTPLVARVGVELVQPPLHTVIAAVLTLGPAIVLLPSQGKYNALWQRILGSAAFAVLAIALLLGPLGEALVVDQAGQPIYELLRQYHGLAVTVGLALAMLDILVTRVPKHARSSKH